MKYLAAVCTGLNIASAVMWGMVGNMPAVWGYGVAACWSASYAMKLFTDDMPRGRRS